MVQIPANFKETFTMPINYAMQLNNHYADMAIWLGFNYLLSVIEFLASVFLFFFKRVYTREGRMRIRTYNICFIRRGL
jgi:hypothetical protein